ncbi:enolase C-terminal domain-like protein [Dyadobacter psychrotolerans]|uniref:L-alanine-DL-glutamate epimerase n=1 Tax=Dyadobacter psychrotolerans TaxID=2541721 RepID=A0A4R5DQ57_9BACT|nr:enolase C-terminal domain-like protein [Dyadobacter psychrotolerans]TDE16486.1 L-alanine-DL-glutamate epimerase [Dyadobacter psychrotolerans]
MNNLTSGENPINRREFVQYSASLMALGISGFPSAEKLPEKKSTAKIRIKNVSSNFDREALNPYRFKGSQITESWQTAAMLESDSGIKKVGLATQGVLWSDSRVAAAHSQSAGNALMYAMSEHALQLMKGNTFADPVSLLDDLLPEVLAYGKKITGIPDLRKTFALNALVSVDNAAWLLYAQENGMKSFDEMIPDAYKPSLSSRHDKVASIPSFPVGTDLAKIKSAADEGYFIMKLKTGSAGTQAEMLENDMAFMTAVHKSIGHYETPYTKNGKIPYYIDPNGRYEKKETLLRFIDHVKKLGALDQIAVIEEPLGEDNDSFVGDVGVRIGADESAHTVEDAAKRIEQGYSVMIVKAIAKTLSMTMKITQLAHEKKIPCFCADLTVNPILVDWNKSVAARLAPFPNVSIGLQETNGHQYYKNWDRLMSYHPKAGANWTKTNKGVYITDKSFFEQSGGIMDSSAHYDGLFEEK